MNSGPKCRCLLCKIENQLWTELTSSPALYEQICAASTNGLRSFPSPFHLLSHLKGGPAGPSSDDLFRDLLASRDIAPGYVEAVLILAFVPVLHGTVRRIAKHQIRFARADITQQALTAFLEVLRSDELRRRHSHFAFAIARSLKRQLFGWAAHEGIAYRRPQGLTAAETADDTMERHACLRHFLSRSIANGLLNQAELDLLIQIKLDGNTGEEVAESNSITPNAVRQRTKRLLAKLRTLAGSCSSPASG